MGSQKKTGRVAVCKVIEKKVLKDINMVRNEIELLRTLDHPNLVRMYEYFEDKDTFYVIFERLPVGDLQEFMSQRGARVPPKLCAVYMRQVLFAINYCHSLAQPVVHRDLKPGNVMKVSGTDVKVIDLGFASMLQEGTQMEKVCGTPMFMAPEVMDRKYGKEADIWSCGIMLYYLISGEFPFKFIRSQKGDGMSDLMAAVKSMSLTFPSSQGWGRRGLSSVRALLKGMLNQDPSKRMDARSALASPFLMNVGSAPCMCLRSKDGPSSVASSKLGKTWTDFALSPPLLRVALLMCVAQMDQQRTGQLRLHFHSVDTDHDGFISSEELGVFLKRNARSLTGHQVLHATDTDGDDRISFSEFAAVWLFGDLASPSFLRHAFEIFDDDRDGLVNRADVIRALETPQMRKLKVCANLAEVASVIPQTPVEFDSFVQHLVKRQRHLEVEGTL